MSAMIVPILPRTLWNFTHLGATAISTQVLSPPLNIAAFDFIGMSVRTHERSMSAGQSVVIAGRTCDPTTEDTSDFAFTTNVAPVTINSGSPTSVPALSTSTAAGTGAGPYLRIILIATQGSGGGTTLVLGVSVTLWLRDK